MNLLENISALGASCLGLVLILFSYKIHTRFRKNYTLSYFYYLLFLGIFSFISFVGRSLMSDFLNHFFIMPQASITIKSFMNLLALPFFIIAWYMMIKMLRQMLEKGISLYFTVGYFAFGFIIVVLALLILSDYIQSGNIKLSALGTSILNFINIIIIVIIFSTFLHIFLHLKGISNSYMRELIKNFSILNLIGLSVYKLFSYLQFSERFYFITMPLFIFIWNFPPLLYIAVSFRRFSRQFSPIFTKNSKLQKFYSEYKITNQEQKIIRMICEGKSNKEIEDKLFISLQTVKRHIYNIYQKLGVKNRVELSNLVRNHFQ